MGVQESKQAFGSSPNLSSTGSLRRSSLYKSTTLDEIQLKHELLRSIQSDIDIFAGTRSDERYKDLQEMLLKTAKDLERIKHKSKKERTRDRCDQVLREVQTSIQRLEAKLTLNESEKGLDLSTEESDSFINHSFTKSPQYYVKPELIRSLNDIETQLGSLEKEVKNAIEAEDTSQFVILEKKITILYGDLVMAHIEDNTPLSERRESIERRLISCNNQIKKCKRKQTKRLSEPVQHAPSVSDESDDIDKTQKRLSELEIDVLTYKGVKTDTRYKELEQTLERYWTNLYALDVFTDEERRKRDTAIEKAKDNLQELGKRAEQNERFKKSLQMLMSTQQQLEVLQKEVGLFKGSSGDSEYTRLDQEARRLWANLNEIEDVDENVTQKKVAAIASIKNALKDLSQNTIKRESQILEEVKQKQLLKQVEEFQIHWSQLNHNLSERTVESSTVMSIVDMLETVLEGIRKKTQALTTAENRKSTASLVVARVTDSSDLYVKYKSAPDLVPQQLGIPEGETTAPQVQNKTIVIAEMHRMGNDAKQLLLQIKQANNPDKELYTKQLNQIKQNLNALECNKKSDTIESNRRRVNKIIDESFKALEEKTRTSTAQEFMDIEAEIQFWRLQIKNFTGTSKDKHYEKIKNGLAESLIKLQVLGDKQVSKQESIQHIQQHHQELETKLAENQAKVKCAEMKRQTSQEIKSTVEQVQKLKGQVDRFSGIYKGILYNQIEGNLTACLKKLDTFDTRGDERLENAKEQTQQKIQKYLVILEEKSTKPMQKLQESNVVKEPLTYQRVYSEDLHKEKQQSQAATPSAELPHNKINTIREELVVIKEKVEGFSGEYKDSEYVAIQKEIEECLKRLKSVDESGHGSILSSKAQYVDYIEKLHQYFEDKTLASDLGDEV